MAGTRIADADEGTFRTLVLESPRPVVVDFWAAWCGPCRMVAPEIERLAERYAGFLDVVKVDIDANPGISQALGIMSIPTIALFRPGREPLGIVGFRPLEDIEEALGLRDLLPARPPAG